MFPLVVHESASPSIWPAVQSHQRGLSTNPGATMWCVCDLASTLCKHDLSKGDLFVQSWAGVRRVRRGRISSELIMCGGGVRSILLLPLVGRCLEKIDVCIDVYYGITTQEPRPRPMKDTLHSRHHSTVLPRLGASRKESLRNLHTHAVDSATKLLVNNRVLKERPPPIADEEQILNQRQRCTPNSGRGTETEPKTTMHYLPPTIRTLPSIAGLQA